MSNDQNVGDMIAHLSTAMKETVTVGQVGHRNDFFARCGDYEIEASTPEEALTSLMEGLRQAIENEVSLAKMAALEGERRLGRLDGAELLIEGGEQA